MNTQANALLPILSAVVIGSFATADIPRTEEGKPDMSGTYNVGTSTSMQRNRIFGDNRYMTEEQAERYTRATQSILQGRTESDPNREAPPDGGDGSPGAAGNVGGYNAFWIPRDGTTSVGKMIPTSIIYEPENGRYPPRTEKSQKGKPIPKLSSKRWDSMVARKRRTRSVRRPRTTTPCRALLARLFVNVRTTHAPRAL